MSIECHVCHYEHNPPDAEYCEVCGAELENTSQFTPIPTNISYPPAPPPTILSPPIAPPSISSPSFIPSPSMEATATARLIAKLPNAPVTEFPINSSAVIGIFTSESGPVDIDLDQFPGSDTISKQHAEIIYQNGTWMIKDNSTTNGTYIKPLGQTRFGARIMAPTPLNSGDEIAFAKVVFRFQIP